MIKKQPQVTPTKKKIPNAKLKEIVSEIIDAPTTEWQNSRIVALVNSDNSEMKLVYNKHDVRLLRMYGMSLYCEACKKYDVRPTDCVGKPIDDVKFNRWLNRAHKLTYNLQYREEFFKPMMYKLNQL